MEKNTTENIFDLLLNRDLTGLCYDIFENLNSESLTNCRLVCHQWKDFIDYHFYKLPKGQKCLQKKLTSNILNENYEAKIKTVKHKEELFAIVADEDGVCISTMAGSVSSYKLKTLEHIWTLKLCHFMVQHCMNRERVFAVNSEDGVGGNVFIIDRSNGHLIQKFHQLHSYGILGVRIFENSILATADLGGYIKFHQINEGTNETNAINVSIILKHEERAYQRPDGYGFTHLDNDGDKLVSGSGKGEVVAWDFRSNKKLYMVDSKQAVMALRVRWPLVVTCTIDLTDDERRKGVKLFNMEEQKLLRHITCDYATDVHIRGNILMICGNIDMNTKSYMVKYEQKRIATHRFWKLSELIDSTLKIEDVSQRIIKTDPNIPTDATRICAIVGSMVLTTEGFFLIQRSFWP